MTDEQALVEIDMDRDVLRALYNFAATTHTTKTRPGRETLPTPTPADRLSGTRRFMLERLALETARAQVELMIGEERVLRRCRIERAS